MSTERADVSSVLAWLVQYWKNVNNLSIVAVCAVLGAGVVGRLLRKQMIKWHLAEKRKEKLSRCQKALMQLEDEVSTDTTSFGRDKILKLNLQQLISKLKSGEVSPVEALQTYQSKAVEVNKCLNCVVEPVTEALDQAKAIVQSTVKGPLYGVPISLKENYGLKGYDCTVGCACFIDKPFSEDAVLVQVLKKQGAIPFVKTNIPQTLLSCETTNPIFGVTKNPYDTTRGVGGSTGGEAALLAAGGSILGFGSDIGGSIRIPANMCGIYGLKPTHLRISNKGMAPLLKGQTCLISTYGPMGRDVDSLVIAMKAVCVPEMSILDPTVPYKPFDSEVYESKRKLKIGYYLQDGFFHAVPAMERAVLEVKQILESLGHEVVYWHYPNKGENAIKTFVSAVAGDGGNEICQLVSGDAVDSSVKVLTALLLLPNFVKRLIGALVNLIYPSMAVFPRTLTKLRTVSDWWKFMKTTLELRESVANDWRTKGLDAVICPGFACPALPIGYSAYATGTVSYTALYNVLNFPAGTLPVTTVNAEDLEKMKDYPLKDLWHRTVKKGMKGSEGLPVNVQVASLPWHEEVILRIMKDIESHTKKTKLN